MFKSLAQSPEIQRFVTLSNVDLNSVQSSLIVNEQSEGVRIRGIHHSEFAEIFHIRTSGLPFCMLGTGTAPSQLQLR